MCNLEQIPEVFTPEAEIRKGIRAICIPGEVYEVRCPKAGKYKVISGYFDDFGAMADQAHFLSDGRAVSAVYVTLNPVRRDLLARAYNAVKNYAEATTTDKDIPRLLRLLIDFDAIRPTGISSSDEEHAHALDLAATVRDFLRSEGWPEPVYGDSGNGGHLIYAIDLENTPENLAILRAVLVALDGRFTNERVKVDTSTFNPSRVVKLPGTKARKGDHMPGFRPHRRSGVIEAPVSLEAVPVELLKRLAAPAPRPKTFDELAAEVFPGGEGDVADSPDEVGPEVPRSAWDRGRLEAFLASHGVGHREPVDEGGRLKYVLDHCAFNPDHAGKDAAVFLWTDGPDRGRLGYHCFHDSCSQKTWADFRELFDPEGGRGQAGPDTSWIDDLLARGGGDGASAFDRPVRGSTEDARDDNDARQSAIYLDLLRGKGLDVTPVGDGVGDTHFRYHAPACPCCREPGIFMVHKKTLKREYNCGGRSGVTWAVATALWGGSAAKRRGFTVEELDLLPTPRWQVQGHWPENSLVMAYGPSGVCKSFYALAAGLSVASGSPFLGQHRTLQGAVAYVVGEGQGGVQRRIKAWLQRHGVAGPLPFCVIPYQFDLTNAGESEAGEVAGIAAGTLGVSPSLVVIDTLNRHFGGGNENDTKDMTSFVRSCDLIRERTGATVAVVHHSGRDASRGERGNIALRNAADVVIACDMYGDRDGMTVECRKMKDAEAFDAYVLRRESVELGGGMTSLVLTLDDSPFAEKAAKGGGHDASVRWKNDEAIVGHFAPSSAGDAWTKSRFVQHIQATMRANDCPEALGDKRIRAAIDALVVKGLLKVAEAPNPHHNRFYKQDAGSGFDVAGFEFFGGEGGEDRG